MIDGYSIEQIYNADECGLIYFSLPTSSYATPEKTCLYGWKEKKNRSTLLTCSNASGGHKLPLVFVHKYRNPRCFKGVKKEELPVYYSHSKDAWMTAEIFETWFHSQFVPKVRSYLKLKNLPPKAILFVDNCSAHPDEDLLKSDDGLIVTERHV